MDERCWLCDGSREIVDDQGVTLPCPVCRSKACEAACAALVAAETSAVSVAPVIPNRGRLITTRGSQGRAIFFPRKPSSWERVDLTGAGGAEIEAAIRRDFGRFVRGGR